MQPFRTITQTEKSKKRKYLAKRQTFFKNFFDKCLRVPNYAYSDQVSKNFPAILT